MPVAPVRPGARVTAIRLPPDPALLGVAVPRHLRLERAGVDRWRVVARRPGSLASAPVLIERHRAWFEVTSVAGGHWRAFATFTGSLAHAVGIASGDPVSAAEVRTPPRDAEVTLLALRRPSARGDLDPRSGSEVPSAERGPALAESATSPAAPEAEPRRSVRRADDASSVLRLVVTRVGPAGAGA